MQQKYLICDCVGSSELEIMTNESAGSTGPIRFRGKFQEANIQNKNKRMYSYDILERERVRLESVIGQKRLFGELDHPTDSIIHLENASHLITKLWWSGNTLLGEGQILQTPAGQILETIIRAGIPVGISSRGVGTGKTDSSGIMQIDPNFRLITFDVVADPSTPEAFIGLGESNNNQFYKVKKENTESVKNFQKNQSGVINSTNKKVDPDELIECVKVIFEQKVNSKTTL